MVRQIEDELRRAGRGDQVTAFVFEGASHFICGGGSEVTRINPIVKPEAAVRRPKQAHAAQLEPGQKRRYFWRCRERYVQRE